MPGKGIVKKDSGKNGGKEQQYERETKTSDNEGVTGYGTAL